jgi:hypothetical protein
MPRVLRFLPALLLAPALVLAQAPYQASAPLSWEIKNARWFDGEKIQKANLYVENGVFIAKKPAKVNRKMEIRNQQLLIAPLAEAHNHNLQTAWGYGQFAQAYLDEGVFYAAMLCGDPANAAEVRPLAATPAAPDLSMVTACITSSDGYPLATLLKDPTPEAVATQQQLVLIDTPEQAQTQWPAIKARAKAGNGWLRVFLVHHDRPELREQPEMFGRRGMSPVTVAALTRLAHTDGLKVAAHVESAGDFDAALSAGVDQIAHLPGYAPAPAAVPGEGIEVFRISPAAAAQAAQQHTAVITTTAATDLFKLEPDELARLRAVQRDNLAQLQAAGVTLLIGSDVFTGTVRAELHALDALGVLPRARLLKLATIDTPRALFPTRRLGCFEPGCEASFLVLGSNPLEDLAALDQPQLRVKQGRLLTRLAEVANASSASTTSTADAPRKAGKSKKPAGKPKAAASKTPR